MSRFLSLNVHTSLVALAVLGIFGAGGVLLTSTDSRAAGEPATKATEPRPALTVSIVRPAPADISAKLQANGNVAAWQEASIGAESNGLRLTEVRVNVGDVVRAGQVLATFAPDTIQADVAQSRANLLEATPRARC